MYTTRLNSGFAASIVLLATFGTATQAANTLHVYADGSGTYPTIQSAVDAAVAGDTVILHPGTYTGTGNYDISYNGKSIIVRGETWDPNDVIISCQGGRGFQFVNDETRFAELHGVTILNGSAGGTTGVGGGIRCGAPGFPPFGPYSGSPYITNCIIRNCSANKGGGMSCTDNSSPQLENVRFEDNGTVGFSGMQGAGLYCLDSSPELMGCVFENNVVSGIGPGGAIYLESSSPVLTMCDFYDNSGSNGGGVCCNSASPDLHYCVFAGNQASAQGGGLYCYGSLCAPDCYNCTFYANQAALAGGGVAAVSFAHARLYRSIIAFSVTSDAAYCYQSGQVTINCCDIYGNYGGPGCVAGQVGSGTNFAADPVFCHPGQYDLTLRDVSPCTPTGSLCGQLVGAESVGCLGPMTFLVCPDGSGDYTTIQPAVDSALDGDTIELCDATYTGPGNRDVDLDGKSLTIRSQSGDATACVIDCEGSDVAPRRAFIMEGDPNEAPITPVLEDITIMHGHADTWPGGGGVLATDAAVTVNGCTFSFCVTDYEGGGLYAKGGVATVTDTTFSHCGSTGIGGGMIYGSGVTTGTATIDNCRFENNTSQDDGGGLAAFSQVDVDDTTFVYNDTRAHGGGVTCMIDAGGSTFTNCWFGENTASNPAWGAGAGISLWVGGITFEWCTFANNSATTEGGGVYGGANYENCTFYGNAAPVAGGIQGGGTLDHTIVAFGTDGEAMLGTVTLTCCDVYGNADGPGTAGPQLWFNGNIALDPLFCDAPADDFTLDCDSPCAAFSDPNPECDLIGAWNVGCGYELGDMNCNCVVGFDDINPFVMALTDPALYATTYPGCDPLNGDLSGNDEFGFEDINPFVALLVGG